MPQLNPDDYQNRQNMARVCGACQARACAGIPGQCPSCARRDNPNPFPGQDGTATSVGSVFTSTVAAELVKTICGDLGIKRDSPPEVVLATFRELIAKADENARELGEYQRKPKPMTDAERKLVDEVLDWEDRNCQVHGGVSKPQAFWSAVKAVRSERKPPEPRPITPEELAVVEAAKQLAPLLKEARDSGTPVDGLYGAKQLLIEFVARLK